MGPMFLSIFFRQTLLLVDGGHSIYRVYSHRSKKNAIIGLAVLKLSNFKFDLHGVLLSLTCVMLYTDVGPGWLLKLECATKSQEYIF